MSRFHFILKRCPSSHAFCRKNLCVEASDAPQRHPVLQGSAMLFLILPNKLLHCLLPPPYKMASESHVKQRVSFP